MHDFVFDNFSIVVNPAIRTAYINNSEVDTLPNDINPEATVKVKNPEHVEQKKEEVNILSDDTVKAYLNNTEFLAFFKEQQTKDSTLDFKRAMSLFDIHVKEKDRKNIESLQSELKEIKELITKIGNIPSKEEHKGVTTTESINKDSKPDKPSESTDSKTTDEKKGEKMSEDVGKKTETVQVKSTDTEKELEELKVRYADLKQKLEKATAPTTETSAVSTTGDGTPAKTTEETNPETAGIKVTTKVDESVSPNIVVMLPVDVDLVLATKFPPSRTPTAIAPS